MRAPALRSTGDPHPSATAETPQPGFADVLAAEWIRLRSVRATAVLAAIVAVALPALAAVVALTGSVMPDDTVLGASILGGGALALLAAGGLGATAVTAEHSSGSIVTSYAGTPRRGRLLAAQAVLVGSLTAAVTLPASAASVVLGEILLARTVPGLAAGHPMPALLGVALIVGTVGMLGVCLGTITRHSGAALAALGAVLLLPSMLGPMLGAAGEWVLGLTPVGILTAMVQSSDAATGTVGSLGAWPRLLFLTVATLGLLGVAGRAALRDL